MHGQEACLLPGSKIILSIKKRKIMAENEFEKNVRREMDEFKVQPTAEVWERIKGRISQNKRRRRIFFFVLFSSIALILAGYGVYNFSTDKTKSTLQNKLPEIKKSNDESKFENSKIAEPNKE